MPFRIRSKKKCLTTSHLSGDHLNTTECINYRRYKDYMEKFVVPQVFTMFPLISNPQKIRHYSTYDDVTLCLHADYKSLSGNPLEHSSISVKTQKCNLEPDNIEVSSMMFTIQRMSVPRIDQHEANQNARGNLKPLSAIQIKWKHPETGTIYCASTNDFDGKLELKFCKATSNRKNSDVSGRGQTFILERAITWGKPYRPGSTEGKWPTWPGQPEDEHP